MNIQQVRERVVAIAGVGMSDPEMAHFMEDQLWVDVLKAIAEGTDKIYGSAADLANEALKTRDLPFERWFA